ncbi:hypothetical protein GT347_20075 [Xylophilus rhododendri]|uniref:Uncharacterized protein n=1 Tax=Xylophilus rhododendri TaxID=2697032 RepID=A0A857JAR8_9BURK|nr:hypothetical protein [Xylophilus rhododendri]QHJ00073.1 hypothetical protein GT347_20075 [Xylophilus rhododendri]
MNAKTETVILPSSPLAAERKSVTCWVGRDGSLWSDDAHGERMARYCGSTHGACADCGATCDKGYGVCDACGARRKLERYAAMPRKAWDGHQMLYSEAKDRYFQDIQDATENLDEGESLTGLRLVLCDPNLPRQLDEDFFCDELPEDGDWHSLPSDLQEAVEAYNKVAASCAPLSWSSGKFALLIEDATPNKSPMDQMAEKGESHV